MKIFTACILLSTLDVNAEEAATDPAKGNGWKIKGWNIQTSLYTKHWDPDPDHTNKQKLIGPELVFENDYLVGLAVFRNSFDQPSQMIYIGKTWPLFRSDYFYFKLIGGLLHGYKEPFEDKIPLNGLGVAPAILPALGFRYKRVIIEAQIAGTAALTITGGLRF
ncbi:MAG: sn-glycerol-3-phosphate transporter [Xanthomonadales bacterium]|nr:sn-glycerol-3-phosphate transporter [Gammaproteobacteria bacterium]MBT8054450.1 sn-glycerol-3-phosphate transporter [Gammaproteobacteria bacterium]NND58464.1 sn-glycerol-3-phosphate transporter [Xanthomonadales bacterium]NNK50115.1 sn-glycerol-3-phosphate transporter [Xanthomonadales bacterium]